MVSGAHTVSSPLTYPAPTNSLLGKAWEETFLFLFLNQIIVWEGLCPYGTQYMQTGGEGVSMGWGRCDKSTLGQMSVANLTLSYKSRGIPYPHWQSSRERVGQRICHRFRRREETCNAVARFQVRWRKLDGKRNTGLGDSSHSIIHDCLHPGRHAQHLQYNPLENRSHDIPITCTPTWTRSFEV